MARFRVHAMRLLINLFLLEFLLRSYRLSFPIPFFILCVSQSQLVLTMMVPDTWVGRGLGIQHRLRPMEAAWQQGEGACVIWQFI